MAPSGNKEHSPERTASSKATLLFPAYCQPYQKLAEYEQLIGNAQELIEQAKGPGGKIKKWQMHAKGISLRESLVRNQVQVMGELIDIVQNAQFWQAFQEVVLEVSPEVQFRLISRLREFEDSRVDKMQGTAKAVPAPRNPKSVHGPAKAKEVILKQGKPEKAAKNSRKPPTSPKQLRLV